MHGDGATETSKHFAGSVARFSSDILAILRLKHPRNSDLGDALPHGGPVTFADDILATLGAKMPGAEVVRPFSPETFSQL